MERKTPGLMVDKDNVAAIFVHDLLVRKYGFVPKLLTFTVDIHNLEYEHNDTRTVLRLARRGEHLDVSVQRGEKTEEFSVPLAELVDDRLIIDKEKLEDNVKKWLSI